MQKEAAKHWFLDEPMKIEPIEKGLLNQTFLVENSKGRFIAQKINPIFSPEVNVDINAMTQHLRAKGFFTWRLVPTISGELWLNLAGNNWRMLNFVNGHNFSELQDKKMADYAGKVVGKFHRALADFKHDYCFVRVNAHDTRLHMNKLSESLEKHKGHKKIVEVSDLAAQILSKAQILPNFSKLPLRHGHGDLKISNLIFGNTAAQSTLIDFDTIGVIPWPVEMGDAFRSWCNPVGEDVENTFFEESIFEVALLSYASAVKEFWSAHEVNMLIEGICTIPLELSSRFLRDVLEDSYFHFDPKRFQDRSSHNLVRAKGQFNLYCDIQKKKTLLEGIVTRAFS